MKLSYLFNIILLPIFLVIFVDQGLKYHAHKTMQVYYNSGFIFGSFADAPPMARIVCIITFFIFFLFGGILLQFFFIKKNKFITISLGIYLGGVSSNSLDRLIKGAVTDHIIFPHFPNLAWNTADISQWFGLFLILMWKHKDNLWIGPTNLRKSLFIDWRIQKRFIQAIMSVTFFIWSALTLFSYSYFRYVIESANPSAFFITSFCLLFLFELCAVIFSIWWSHKFAGPIYAFERYIDSLINNNSDSLLKLRSGDEIKNLEKIAEKVHTLIKK
jgi:signal peptidase II